jgi:hypothetical protein
VELLLVRVRLKGCPVSLRICYINEVVERRGESFGEIMIDKLWLDMDGGCAIAKVAKVARCWLLTSDSWCTKWLWGRILFEFFDFPLPVTISPLLHTHLSPPHEVCDSRDQAAHYHTLGPKLGSSFLP